MKFEIRVNGRMELRVTPETVVERAVIEDMLARAKNGHPLKLSEDEGVAVIWMEGA